MRDITTDYAATNSYKSEVLDKSPVSEPKGEIERLVDALTEMTALLEVRKVTLSKRLDQVLYFEPKPGEDKAVAKCGMTTALGERLDTILGRLVNINSGLYDLTEAIRL